MPGMSRRSTPHGAQSRHLPGGWHPNVFAGGGLLTVAVSDQDFFSAADCVRVVDAPPWALYNNAEGGTNGVTPTTSDTGSGNPYDTVNDPANSTVQYSTAQAAHGTTSISVATGASGTETAYLAWSTQLGTFSYIQVRAYVYLTAAPSTTDAFLELETLSATFQGGIQIQTNKTLLIQNAAFGTVHTMTSTLPLNAWFRVEALFTLAGVNGAITLNYYATPDSTTVTESYTGAANFGASANQFQIGWNNGHPSQPTTYVDDVAATTFLTGGLLGPVLTLGTLEQVALSNGDSGSGTESQHILVSSTDSGSFTDAGETVKFTATDASSQTADSGTAGQPVSSSDTWKGTDGKFGGTPVSGSDSGSFTDAGEQVSLSSSDTASGTDAGNPPPATLSSPDTASGTDAGEKISLSLGDTGSGSDGGNPPPATLSNADTASGTDAGEKVSLSSSDSVSGTDAGSPPSAALSSSDTSSGTDAGEKVNPLGSDSCSGSDGGNPPPATLSNPDTVTGTDAATKVNPLGSDSCSGSDGGNPPPATLSNPDTVTGTDSLAELDVVASDNCSGADGGAANATFSSSDTASGTEAVTDVGVFSSDTASGTDAFVSIVQGAVSADSGSFTDAGNPPPATLSSADSGNGSESGTITVASSDTCSGSDNGTPTSATLSSPDTGSFADAGEKVHFTVADTGSFADAGETVKFSAADASSQTVDAGEKIKFSSSDASSTTLDAGEKVNPLGSDSCSGSDSWGGTKLSATDSGTFADAGETIHIPTSADTCTGVDAGSVNTNTPKSDSDVGHFQDSEIDYVVSGDSGSGSETSIVSVPATDSGSAAETGSVHITGSVFLSDVDAGSAAEAAVVRGTGTQNISDSDAGSAAEAVSTFLILGQADTGTFVDTLWTHTGTGVALSGIDVWTTIPDYLFLRGGDGLYNVVWHPGRHDEKVLISGAQLSRWLLNYAEEMQRYDSVTLLGDVDAGSASEDNTPLLNVAGVVLTMSLRAEIPGRVGAPGQFGWAAGFPEVST
jgi:hypothetical protein